MKFFPYFIAAFLISLLTTLGVRYSLLLHQQSLNRHQAVISPTVLPTSAFSLANAPHKSLRGTLTSLIGDVKWQSRTATDSSPLQTLHEIQQGENLETGKDGVFTLLYANVATISAAPNTKLEIIQTLPGAMVFREPVGDITYIASVGAKLSIRSLHLLTEIDGGKANILTDDTNNIIHVSLTSGTAKVSFNDLDNKTSITTITPSETLVYDDKSRTASLR